MIPRPPHRYACVGRPRGSNKNCPNMWPRFLPLPSSSSFPTVFPMPSLILTFLMLPYTCALWNFRFLWIHLIFMSSCSCEHGWCMFYISIISVNVKHLHLSTDFTPVSLVYVSDTAKCQLCYQRWWRAYRKNRHKNALFFPNELLFPQTEVHGDVISVE